MSLGVPTWTISPWFMTPMREASVIASSWSWVTTMKVTPSFSWMLTSSNCVCSRSLRSSAPSGSSSNSSFGCFTSERASATRWRWPPESWCGLRPANDPILTNSSMAATRSLISARGNRSCFRPKATFCSTVMCGNSA